MRKKGTHESGLSLAEVLIALAGTIVVIGALMTGSIALQKSFHHSESYASSQTDQRRLIDWVARDLRRAIGLSVSAPGGAPTRLSAGSVTLDATQVLTITLPAYYRSHSSADSAFAEALPLIAAGDRVAYGTLAGPEPAFSVSFRKLFLAEEKSMCFVREEGGSRQVIVRGAEDLNLEVALAADGESCSLVAQFHSTFSRHRVAVDVHDRVMLRNVRID